MSSMTEVRCFERISGVCEVDPDTCINLNDSNTAEENIIIPAYEQVKDITTFDILSPTKLTQVPSFILKKFPKLEMLRMINTGIKELNVDNFPHGNGLKDLDLRQNNITSIRSAVFANLTSLRHINLADNLIDHIEPGAFDHLPILNTLFLSNNKLEGITTNSLPGTGNLTELYLGSNAIRFFASDALNSTKLEILSLENNRLSSLPNDIFDKMLALEKVDLGGNDFKEIGNLLNKCKRVYSLRLNDNPNLIDVDIFHLTNQLPELSYLHLANTGYKFPSEYREFTDAEVNYALTHLDLSANQLSDPRILFHLQHFKSLKTLILAHNSFKSIDQMATIKAMFPRMETINLNQNANIDADWLRHTKSLLRRLRVRIITDIEMN